MLLTPLQKRWLPRLALIVAPVLALAGCLNALSDTFRIWSLNGDTISPFIVADGLTQYGPRFLAHWGFTQDNWLLSLVPMDGLLEKALGTSPTLVIGIGYAIFLANTLLLTLLSRLVLGPRGWLLAPLFCLITPDAAGNTGFLTHSVTHTITFLWGLLGLLCATRALTKGPRALPLSLSGTAITLTIATLSDPWGQVAFILPMLAATLPCLATKTIPRRHTLSLATTLLAIFILCHTRFFGLLWWLPKTAFAFGTLPSAWAHLHTLTHAELTLFSLDTLPKPLSFLGPILLLTLIAAATIGTITHTLLKRRNLTSRDVLRLSLTLSLLATQTLYIIGQFSTDPNIGRFVINVFPFSLITALALRTQARIPVILATLLITLAKTDGISLTFPTLTPRIDGPANLAETLETHNLTYGFGPYWGANPEGLTWSTHHRLTMLPVTFDPTTGQISRRTAQTSDLWYAPTTPRPKTFFVIIMNDGENCQSIDLCKTGLRNQFGPPDETLPFANTTILTWHKPAPELPH